MKKKNDVAKIKNPCIISRESHNEIFIFRQAENGHSDGGFNDVLIS